MRNLLLLLIYVISTLSACKKKDSPLVLEKPKLILPAKDEICNTGNILNEQQTRITFSWSSPTGAEAHTLILKNLQDNTEQKIDVVGNSVVLTVSRNTPYVWHIISRSTKTIQTSTSEAWRFYAAGNGNLSYAPFPAEITSPKYAETVTGNTINLTWKGSDVDNDIVAYDVYLSTGSPSSTPQLLQSNVKNQLLKDIPVNFKNINYVWRIVTRDASGNTSTSESFMFKMK